MLRLDMMSEGEPGDHPGHYWIALHGAGDNMLGKEEVGVICMA
jgi:hypothetical protein